MGVTTRIRDELRLARLRERLEDRPNNLHATVQAGEPRLTDLTPVNGYSMAAITGSVEWCVRQSGFDASYEYYCTAIIIVSCRAVVFQQSTTNLFAWLVLCAVVLNESSNHCRVL